MEGARVDAGAQGGGDVPLDDEVREGVDEGAGRGVAVPLGHVEVEEGYPFVPKGPAGGEGLVGRVLGAEGLHEEDGRRPPAEGPLEPRVRVGDRAVAAVGRDDEEVRREEPGWLVAQGGAERPEGLLRRRLEIQASPGDRRLLHEEADALDLPLGPGALEPGPRQGIGRRGQDEEDEKREEDGALPVVAQLHDNASGTPLGTPPSSITRGGGRRPHPQAPGPCPASPRPASAST